MAAADLQEKLEDSTRPDGEKYAPFPLVLRVFWVASLALFGLMFLVRSLELRAGFSDSFYHFLGPRFTDLTEYIPTFKLLHTATFFHNSISVVAYPPFGAVIYGVLYSFGWPVAFYLSIAAVWLGVATIYVRRALIERGVDPWTATLFPPTIVLASLPIMGLLQSGNLELFVWIFAAAGTWAYLRGHDDAAAVLWALAAATKLYPVIFFALLLPRRNYRALAVGVGSFVVASVACMWFLGPSIPVAWHGSLQNVFGYQGVRVADWNLHELGANHSVFGWVKVVATVADYPLSKLTLPWYAAGAVVFGTIFFGKVIRMPVANQLLAVSTFMLMLPPVSYFYTLVHLYAPWLVLVFLALRASRACVRVRGLNVAILLFLPLFASYTLLTFPGVYLFGGLIQACVLIVLFLCAATYPFAEPVAAFER